ncbi:hypothetical protein E2C01_080763 [Portunus trituberculatus]|uniref:Uncharacterized protein n=1 Tax=Portunus trituberculatus TaxID=210409 RepID=A0A5B7IWY5_PORTR|nr:hypothetical protein [Portunus trituberculatus]
MYHNSYGDLPPLVRTCPSGSPLSRCHLDPVTPSPSHGHNLTVLDQARSYVRGDDDDDDDDEKEEEEEEEEDGDSDEY